MKKQRESFVKDLTNDLDNDDITAKCLAEKDVDNSVSNSFFKIHWFIYVFV